MFTKLLTATAALLLKAVHGNDPAGGWEAYARFAAKPTDTITRVKATTVVPPYPEGSTPINAWWYGLQTAKGNGALIQPIMPAIQGKSYYMFHEVFDWTDESNRDSTWKSVHPGDKLTAEVTTKDRKTFHMNMTSSRGQTSVLSYTLEEAQEETESVVFFVFEKPVNACRDLPSSNRFDFTDIEIDVNDVPVTDVLKQITTHPFQPFCNMTFHVGPESVYCTWTS